ncbi:50S ribosomal protein L3 [Candidatus Woesearchaeota archaeon]|nr:50S ribosomal protein L3 [Candidatus Woesearchaeota archaeon]
MPRTRKPRAGSMQFWPRVRSRYTTPRIRNWASGSDVKPLGFVGYKVGMTHILINDNLPNSMTKGKEIFCPVTIIECPPIKTASIRLYKNTQNGVMAVSEIFAELLDKEMEKKITTHPKKEKTGKDDYGKSIDFDFLRLCCYTQPKLTSIGKKTPEIFEIAIGGAKEQQLNYAREKLGKEINISDAFKEGQLLDIHSTTKGKGFQGPMRRFGVQLRHHKSEKSRRNPGTLGAWNAQGHIMWRTAHAGKMGYHLRTEYNKWLIKVGNKPEEINANGGFINYGFVKNPYILVKGSIAGAKNRLIKMTMPTRQKINLEAPQVSYISTHSKQGN